MMQESLAERLRILRAQQGLTLTEASKRIGINRHTLRQLELGARQPYYPTLSKIAEGYGVPVEDLLEEPVLSGKAEAPPSPEQLSFLNEVEAGEERRTGLESLIRRRLQRFDGEIKDPNSTKFRTATAATDWLADVQNEAADWISWALEHATTGRDDLLIMGLAAEFGRIKRLAESRIEAMSDQPDALARRRLETANQEFSELREASGS